ncbi:MAG: hypothetical protein ACRDD1_09140, partial [Planctomycetia bacterium]
VNDGTQASAPCTVELMLPQGVAFASTDSPDVHFDPSVRCVVWNIGSIQPFQRVRVPALLAAQVVGEFPLEVVLNSEDALQRDSVHRLTADGSAALTLEITDELDPVEVDGETTFLVKVSNRGGRAATKVEAVVEIEEPLKPTHASGPGRPELRGSKVAFPPVDSIAPGETIEYRVRAKGVAVGEARVVGAVRFAESPRPLADEESTQVLAKP